MSRQMLLALATLTTTAVAGVPEKLGTYLEKGQLKEATQYLDQQLKETDDSDQVRFAKGVVQLLTAVEQLGQDQYRYGALSGTVRNTPVLRLPVPTNKDPEEVTYEDMRKVFEKFQAKILEAEKTLASVDTSKQVKLPIDLASIKIDLNGDGEISDAEGFSGILQTVNRRRPQQDEQAPGMNITFDLGDVPWLRGYCHFLAAFCDFVLAYDHQNLFDHCGHLIYRNAVHSKELTDEPLDIPEAGNQNNAQFLDAIAAIHLMNFPVREPKRMASARIHLLEMINTSRESWELITAEEDDDHEWLPNPKQTGVLQIPITQDVIDGWHLVLIEMEEILEGRKLIPFWRDYFRFLGHRMKIPQQGRGVNLKRYFEEPSDFDLILTFQGSSVLQYIERGELSTPETWNNLQRVFRGQFFGFAVWFN